MQAIEVYWSSLRAFRMKRGRGREENSACENAKGRSTRSSLTSFPAVFPAPFVTPSSIIKAVKNAVRPLFMD